MFERAPEERCARPWGGQWRLVLFDVPAGQYALHEWKRRYRHDRTFRYLHDSVWITPDPLEVPRQILGPGKINVESRVLKPLRLAAVMACVRLRTFSLVKMLRDCALCARLDFASVP